MIYKKIGLMSLFCLILSSSISFACIGSNWEIEGTNSLPQVFRIASVGNQAALIMKTPILPLGEINNVNVTRVEVDGSEVNFEITKAIFVDPLTLNTYDRSFDEFIYVVVEYSFKVGDIKENHKIRVSSTEGVIFDGTLKSLYYKNLLEKYIWIFHLFALILLSGCLFITIKKITGKKKVIITILIILLIVYFALTFFLDFTLKKFGCL